MKKIFKLVGMSLFILIFMTACGNQWQHHYELGMQYLSDGNYEEAIIEFEAAIKIDDKRVDAYIGQADAYIGKQDYVSAKQAIEAAISVVGNTDELQTKLTILEKMDNGYFMLQSNDIIGNLQLEDVFYKVEAKNGTDAADVELDVRLSAPKNARDISVWTWQYEDFSTEEIQNCMESANETDYSGYEITDEFPFERALGFELHDIRNNQNLNVLLIAHDENMQSIGYAVVPVEVRSFD